MKKEEITELLKILQCPISGGNLSYNEDKKMFYSASAKVFYPVKNGIPIILESAAIKEDTL